jgi:hypothetical protein
MGTCSLFSIIYFGRPLFGYWRKRAHKWGKRNGYNCILLESFIGAKKSDGWNDFVAVFIKDGNFALQYQSRIQDYETLFEYPYRFDL